MLRKSFQIVCSCYAWTRTSKRNVIRAIFKINFIVLYFIVIPRILKVVLYLFTECWTISLAPLLWSHPVFIKSHWFVHMGFMSYTATTSSGLFSLFNSDFFQGEENCANTVLSSVMRKQPFGIPCVPKVCALSLVFFSFL